MHQKYQDNVGPRYFSWLRVNEIAGSSRPSTVGETQWLKNQGIQHILTLSNVLHNSIFKNSILSSFVNYYLGAMSLSLWFGTCWYKCDSYSYQWIWRAWWRNHETNPAFLEGNQSCKWSKFNFESIYVSGGHLKRRCTFSVLTRPLPNGMGKNGNGIGYVPNGLSWFICQ